MVAETSLVSIQEYLGTAYKPACDYIDGVLRRKSMPTFDHGNTQYTVCELINRLGGFRAIPEQTVRIREGKYFVPDVAVQRLIDLQKPYPVKPVHLCIEVLSPDDRFGDVVAKCDEYHAWGVEHCWILDPGSESRANRCWQYDRGGQPNEVPADGRITAGPIILNHADIFAPL
jgi:Uma2 family endonuclease